MRLIACTHVKDINARFVDKEAFEQRLDNDQTLSKNQDRGVYNRAGPSMEDCKKGELNGKREGKQDHVDQERYDG